MKKIVNTESWISLINNECKIKDINDNPNVSGSGINMAQRCMDAGDNDHILISKPFSSGSYNPNILT